MTTVVSILLSDVIPLRERGTWQGYLNIVYATGASAGAPLGGILADSIGWRWYVPLGRLRDGNSDHKKGVLGSIPPLPTSFALCVLYPPFTKAGRFPLEGETRKDRLPRSPHPHHRGLLPSFRPRSRKQRCLVRYLDYRLLLRFNPHFRHFHLH